MVETVSFSVQFVDENKPDDTKEKKASDPTAAKPVPTQQVQQ